MVLTDKDAYIVGETVSLRARILDEGYEPVVLPAVEVMVRGGRNWEKIVVLEAEAGRKGWYEGHFVPPEPGLYDVRGHRLGPVKVTRDTLKSLQVKLPALEFTHSRMDRGALTHFAEKTGGRYVPLEELADLPEALPALREKTVISEKPIKLWDNWIVLVAILLLLTVEWTVRKISRMA
jgi:hypothetical protein